MKKMPKALAGKKQSKADSSVSALSAPLGWTFLTNHTHVLHCLYRQSDQRLRDVAAAVGITERMVQRIVSELVDAGYVKITKEGRCNRYTVNESLRLRHTLEVQHTIGELLALINSDRARHK